MKYLSQNSLKETINYFTEFDMKSPEQLGLFFFFKGLGFNTKIPYYYKKVGEMNSDEKEKYNQILFNLGALFDFNEKPGKRTCLFPFSISNPVDKSSYFNGGTPFKSLLSRIRDTVDNTLIDTSKYLRVSDDNTDKFKFARNYIDILCSEAFLNGKRISLTYFSAWYMRFRAFDVDEKAQDDDLRNACIEKTCEELNISSEEINNIFIDDRKTLSFVNTEIHGNDLRDMLSFKGELPEIFAGNIDFDLLGEHIVDREYINEVVQSVGDNISPDNLYELLQNAKQVILHGVPGTGKSFITKQIESKFEKVQTVQFHPSMSYEQFIGGHTIDLEGNLVTKAGVFLKACKEASGMKGDYLFIIDEINRGNISKIFGETILVLDREYEVDLVSPLRLDNGDIITDLKIPENLYIIGTMNSADRSIAFIDYAIRRRFAFVKFNPNYSVVQNNSEYMGNYDVKIYQIMKQINLRILEVLKNEDLLLGQSFFMPDWIKKQGKFIWTDVDLKDLFNYYIIPIIEEYTYGNINDLRKIVGVNISNRIQDTDKFIKELVQEFYPRSQG
ncbi:AAA family ATPase [Peptoniphilus sp. MSJ-1]|uniref:AAA family ATPase n=1 Tax=Peptoniphilus ovalis TaxID=2841503 RepID=A0ABS6FIK3_9FIRM|nr:AAA family ATPase [Peptoniphilus ovalis]MBU5669268.1 AAA family ATPase [Peptoniphilus ovalis]